MDNHTEENKIAYSVNESYETTASNCVHNTSKCLGSKSWECLYYAFDNGVR